MTREEALRLLCLKTPFSLDELKAAYKEVAFVWHPDRFENGSEKQKKAEERLKQINEAYDFLKKSYNANDARSKSSSHRESSQEGQQSSVILTEEITYLGDDPRLETKTFLSLKKQSGNAVLTDKGVILFLQSGGNQRPTAFYPQKEFIGTISGTRHFLANPKNIDYENYDPVDHRTNENEIVFQLSDPAGIETVIFVRLRFINTYLAKRFAKELNQRFCPYSVEKEWKNFRQQKEAERRKREEQEEKSRKEAMAREEEQKKQLQQDWNNQPTIEPSHYVSGIWAVLMCLMIGVIILAPALFPNTSTKEYGKEESSNKSQSDKSPFTPISETSAIDNSSSMQESAKITFRRDFQDEVDSKHESKPIRRNHAESYYRIGMNAVKNGNYIIALQKLEQGSRFTGDYAEQCRNNLAWLLATSPIDSVRNGKRAVELADELLKLESNARDFAHKSSNSWTRYGTAAAAYAEIENFDKAVELQKVSLKMCPAKEVESVTTRLKLFQQGQKFRDPTLKPASG